MRKKILIINTSFRYEGPNSVLWNVANHADTSRFELVFACMHEGGPMEADYRKAGFDTHNFGMTRFTDLGSILRVRNYIRAGKFDLVMVQLLRAEVFGGCGAWLSGVPLALVIYNTDPYRADPRILPHFLLSRLAMLWPRNFVACSEYVRSYVIEHQRVNTNRIRTIRCVVDVERIKSLAHAYEMARSEFRFAPDALVIGTVARLDPQKGLMNLLLAFKSLYPRHQQLRLLIVGDGPMRVELQEWVRRENLEDRILFTGFRSDYDTILQGFDIFALPSLWEGLPMVLMDAMASGKPIVTTRVAGIPEVIEHDSNGLLAPPGDPALFADLLEKLLLDCSLRARLAAKALEYAERYLSAEAMTRQYEQMWLDTINAANA